MGTLLSIYQEQLNKAVPGRPLLTVVNSHLESTNYDMLTLDEKSDRAAAFLRAKGCRKGDRVLISSRDTVQIWSFFWGTLKIGAVPCILFPELGTGGLEVRLKTADADFFITDIDSKKLGGEMATPEALKTEFLSEVLQNGQNLWDHINTAGNWQQTEWADVDENDDGFIVFTSGTTGTPKPVIHRQGIADAIVRSMKNVLHASEKDVYWCTAHPAWITGVVYGIIGPVLCGIPSVQYEGRFHAKRWMPILQEQRVSLWYTAPSAMRGLMREDRSFYDDFDFSSLRQIYSIGEPLSVREYEWGQETFRQPVYDTWFQTECGTIRIANQPDQKLIPGWMGKPVDDCEVIITEKNELLLKSGFSSMFKSYYNMPEATSQKIYDDIYETGDLASCNEDGFLHFEGRADDVINTSGHLVGPLEIEQVLDANPAIAISAVVAEPDELCFEVPAAYIILAEGYEWSRHLETALKVAVNTGISSYAVPKHFYPVQTLPQTPSGKIDRKQLKKL